MQKEKHITTMKRFPPLEKFKKTPQPWAIIKKSKEFLSELEIIADKNVYDWSGEKVYEVDDDWSFILVEDNDYALVYGDSPLLYGDWVLYRKTSKFEKAIEEFKKFLCNPGEYTPPKRKKKTTKT